MDDEIIIDEPSLSVGDLSVIEQSDKAPQTSSLKMITSFKPPHKAAKDLNSDEIQALLTNQKRHNQKWISTSTSSINGYASLLYQRTSSDVIAKTKYVRCNTCLKVYADSGGHLKLVFLVYNKTNALVVLDSF